NLSITRSRGATLLGRVLGAEGHTVYLKDDLQQNATGSDKAAFALRARLDKFVEDKGIDPADAPEDPPIEPAPTFPEAPTQLHLKAHNINTVIW
ncbi:hypothetical protein NL529_27740, partial [Klebsiella pneumoniae]|nr:hypothetical protein [Klebsiella pneumoniae]